MISDYLFTMSTPTPSFPSPPTLFKAIFKPDVDIEKNILDSIPCDKISIFHSNDDLHFLEDERFSSSLEIHKSKLYQHTLYSSSTSLSLSKSYFRSAVSPLLLCSLPQLASFLHTNLPQLASSLLHSSSPITPKSHLVNQWISSQGAITPLHYDRCHGFLLQVVGRKRFIVFHKDDFSNLYMYQGYDGPTHCSKLRGVSNIYCHDSVSSTFPSSSIFDREWFLKTYPKLKCLQHQPLIFDLEPGDVLFTPALYLHHVESIDGSISITVPYDMTEQELASVSPHF